MEVGKKKGKNIIFSISLKILFHRQRKNERYDEAYKRAPNKYKKSRIIIEKTPAEENLRQFFLPKSVINQS